jgi:hypothetical protein
VVRRTKKGFVDCDSHNREALRFITESEQIKYVFIVARWTLYLENSWFENNEGGREFEPELGWTLERNPT